MTTSQSSLDKDTDVEKQPRSIDDDTERATERATVRATEAGVLGGEDPTANGALADSNTVWWDGEDDPQNPMNWSMTKKWAHVSIVSLITFVV
jgi:hypothetical protein